MKIIRQAMDWGRQKATGTAGSASGTSGIGGSPIDETGLADGDVLIWDVTSGTWIVGPQTGGTPTSPIQGAPDAGSTGGKLVFDDASGGGGFAAVVGGNGDSGLGGGSALLSGGSGNGGSVNPAFIYADGGTATDPGFLEMTTNNSSGVLGEFMGANGDGTASWLVPAGGGGGRYEVVMASGITNPPDPVTTPDGSDWVYALV